MYLFTDSDVQHLTTWHCFLKLNYIVTGFNPSAFQYVRTSEDEVERCY